MPAQTKCISVTEEQWARVQAACKRYNQSPSEMIRNLCMDHLYPTNEQWKQMITEWLNSPGKRAEAMKQLSEPEQVDPTPA